MGDPHISARLAAAADEVTRTALYESVVELGPPPAPFAWIALGSQARRALHCASDQDSALAWATDEAAASPYAHDLADRVVTALDSWGLARCTGGFMADGWSFSQDHWQRLLHEWVMNPTPTAVVDTEVFLDFRPLAGDLNVDHLAEALHSGTDSPRLQHWLAVAAVSFRVHLSWLGHVKGHTFDTKLEGLAPLVLLARVFALRAGSTSVTTTERLADAAHAGVLSDHLVADLIDAHDLLSSLRLQQQLADVSMGLAPGHIINIDQLDKDELRRLEHGMHAIKSAQSVADMVFRTDL